MEKLSYNAADLETNRPAAPARDSFLDRDARSVGPVVSGKPGEPDTPPSSRSSDAGRPPIPSSAPPMKVLMVLTFYHPHWTGLTAYARRLAEGLARRGHSVTVLTSRHRADLAEEEMLEGVRVLRLPVATRLSRGVLMPAFPARLWQEMRRADIVQLHSPILEAPLIALYGKLLGRAVVFTHHGDLVMPAGLLNRVVERTVTALMVRALSMSTRITVHSCDYAKHSAFLSPFSNKLDCIYPPADLPPPDLAAISRWKEERGLAGRPLVGFAGRWVEEKGFDILLQAIPHVLREVPAAQFLYAGARPDYEDFLSRCEPLLDPVRERVTMLGLLTDPQKLADFYGMCDLFAVPSRTDCFPSTQIEAILCGTPLVTADIPGAREVVQVTRMGLLAAPLDPAALARGIIEVIRNRASFVRPPAEVRAVFDAQKSVEQYEDLLRRLAVRRAAA